MQSTKLTDVLTRCRTALFGPSSASTTISLPVMATSRPTMPPPATVTPKTPDLPTADAIAQGIPLSAGATKVWTVLHDLAVYAHRDRATERTPDALTYHLPTVALAALVGYTERHTYRLLAELNAAGLIHSAAHVGKVGFMRRYTGTLFCVALRPGARPRLRYWDYQADWRPDFETDYYGESGAWRQVQQVMSEPLTYEGKQGRLWGIAKSYVVVSRTAKTALSGGSDMRPGVSFGTLADDLPGIWHMHPRQRHRAVTEWSTKLSALLGEPHRVKQWCEAVYRALAAQNELRPALETVAQELRRYAAELRNGEHTDLRRPGALLASRLR